MTSRALWAQRLLPYLYIGPALTVACVFSFVSMGISMWVSLHDFDAFAGASEFVGFDNYHRALYLHLIRSRDPLGEPLFLCLNL